MNGLLVGLALLASTAGAAPAPAAAEVEAKPPRLILPLDFADEQPRPHWREERPRKARMAAARQSSTAGKVIGVAVGAVGGFFAGGMAGFYLTQDRDRDDDGVSGLRGVVIGAPIGAAVGALIGYHVGK